MVLCGYGGEMFGRVTGAHKRLNCYGKIPWLWNSRLCVRCVSLSAVRKHDKHGDALTTATVTKTAYFVPAYRGLKLSSIPGVALAFPRNDSSCE